LGQAGYQVLIGHTGYSILEEERLIDTYLSYGV
jgi:LacI family gluconate utilization system Gnt-I transcriptional repressor